MEKSNFNCSFDFLRWNTAGQTLLFQLQPEERKRQGETLMTEILFYKKKKPKTSQISALGDTCPVELASYTQPKVISKTQRNENLYQVRLSLQVIWDTSCCLIACSRPPTCPLEANSFTHTGAWTGWSSSLGQHLWLPLRVAALILLFCWSPKQGFAGSLGLKPSHEGRSQQSREACSNSTQIQTTAL